MVMGALLFGLEAVPAAQTLVPRFSAALRELGVDLGDRTGATASIERLRALRARDPAAFAVVADGVRNLGWLVTRDTDEDPRHAVERSQVVAILAAFPPPAWPELEAAAERLRAGDADALAPLVKEEALRGLSAEQLVELAGAAMEVPALHGKAVELFDRAIRQRPGEFNLHFRRAGLGMMVAMPLLQSDPAAGKAAVARVVHHAGVCAALRPGSGFVRMMLASAQAISGAYEESLVNIEASTQLEPDNAIVWYMKGHFYSYTDMFKTRAVEACTRALELDPELASARTLLDSLGTR
jgi:hypothetical protein